VDEPTGFDKNRGAIFGRRGLAAAVRSAPRHGRSRQAPAAVDDGLRMEDKYCRSATRRAPELLEHPVRIKSGQERSYVCAGSTPAT
jgi:hypothetical protein